MSTQLPLLADCALRPLTPADARAYAAAVTDPSVMVAAGRDVMLDPDNGWMVWRGVVALYPYSTEAWMLTQLAARMTGRWWWKVWGPCQIGSHAEHRPTYTVDDLSAAAWKTLV